jgi:hypothetical protein
MNPVADMPPAKVPKTSTSASKKGTSAFELPDPGKAPVPNAPTRAKLSNDKNNAVVVDSDQEMDDLTAVPSLGTEHPALDSSTPPSKPSKSKRGKKGNAPHPPLIPGPSVLPGQITTGDSLVPTESASTRKEKPKKSSQASAPLVPSAGVAGVPSRTPASPIKRKKGKKRAGQQDGNVETGPPGNSIAIEQAKTATTDTGGRTKQPSSLAKKGKCSHIL